MSRHLLSIDELTPEEIEGVLARAAIHERANLFLRRSDGPTRVLGLLFTEPSLRTRVGFSVAAARLGWQSVQVVEPRSGERSMPESLHDTLRTMSGFVDVVVARIEQPVSTVVDAMTVPLINGGDGGPSQEHPSQALVDLYAIEHELGPIGELRVAVCGDLRMRAVRSLLRALCLRPPVSVSLISVPEMDGPDLSMVPTFQVDHRGLNELEDIDVLYVAGMPHQAVAEKTRDTLRVTPLVLAGLPEASIVLSPMPVIDEIDDEARRDSRVRMFEQSDWSVAVRMSILERLLMLDS